jgi:hypothetical protein
VGGGRAVWRTPKQRRPTGVDESGMEVSGQSWRCPVGTVWR